MEQARYVWLEHLGFNRFCWEKDGYRFAVRHVNLDYRLAVTVWQPFEMVTRVTAMRPTALTFLQQIRLAQAPHTIHFEAEIVIVIIDNNGRLRKIPTALIEKLEVK